MIYTGTDQPEIQAQSGVHITLIGGAVSGAVVVVIIVSIVVVVIMIKSKFLVLLHYRGGMSHLNAYNIVHG